MGSLDETAVAFETLIAEYERVRADLAAIRVDVLQARDELHGRLGFTQHPLILQALGATTTASRRIEQADAFFAAAIVAAREHAAALGISLGHRVSSAPTSASETVSNSDAAGDARNPEASSRRVFDRDEQYARLPVFDEEGSRTTHGRAVDRRGREYELRSGDKRRDAALIDAAHERLRQRGLLGPHTRSAATADVEQKFATRMRLEGIDEADLVINNPNGPCPSRLGCQQTLPIHLDPGQRLTVHWRDKGGNWHRLPPEEGE